MPKKKSTILSKGEQHYNLKTLAKLLPEEVSRSTLLRWIREGINGVKLEHIEGTKGFRSSLEAYYRFYEEIQG